MPVVWASSGSPFSNFCRLLFHSYFTIFLGFILPIEAFCGVLVGDTVGGVELLKPHPVGLDELVFLH